MPPTLSCIATAQSVSRGDNGCGKRIDISNGGIGRGSINRRDSTYESNIVTTSHVSVSYVGTYQPLRQKLLRHQHLWRQPL